MHPKKPRPPAPLAAPAPAPRRTAKTLGANARRADSRKADIRRADSAQSAKASVAQSAAAKLAATQAFGVQFTATQTAGAQTVPTSRTEPASRTAPADPRPASRRRRHSPDSELRRWLAKYEPIERAIIEERARRLASAEKRRMKRRLAFAAECEETEGLAKVLRQNELLRGGKRKRKDARNAGIPPSPFPVPHAPLARIGNTNLHILDGGIVSVLLWVLGVKCTRDVDAMRHRLKRPIYYARENARRRALAAERRKVRMRKTANPCPTREEVLDAWVHAKDSREAMLRFGGMMEDLECYVDNSLRFGANGEVVGRAPGIKGWLQMNIPALYSKYTTVMRYKAAAKKMRQVVGLRDPMPVSKILSAMAEGNNTATNGDATTKGEESAAKGENEILMRTKQAGDRQAGTRMRGADGRFGPENQWTEEERRAEMRRWGEEELRKAREQVALEALRARAVYLEAMDGVPDNATRTIQRLDELLDPERIEDATMLKTWRERYENEITMRTKLRWFGKLFGSVKKDRETA